MPTLNELIKINDMNLADVELGEVFNRAPLLAAAEAVPSSNGTQHSYLVEDGMPSVGFRAVNAGRDNTSGSDRVVTANLKLMDASFTVDKALADAYKGGPEAYIQREARRFLRAGLYGAEGAILNGDVDGFNGLAQAVTDSTNAEYYVDAGATDALQSAYLIHTAEDGFAVVSNEELEIGETFQVEKLDAQGKPFTGLRTTIQSWMTIQVGAKSDIVRINNLGTKTVEDNPVVVGLTDDRLYEAAAKMPSGKAPNLVVCTRREQENLRKSRVNTTPDGRPVPTPEDIPGIGRLIVTDAIPTVSTADPS
ncbi:MAG: major capsid protein [Planctomycetota bacterium]